MKPAKECLTPPDVYTKCVLPLLNTGKVIKFSCVNEGLRSAVSSLLMVSNHSTSQQCGVSGVSGVSGDQLGGTDQSCDLYVQLDADKWTMSQSFAWMLEQVRP